MGKTPLDLGTTQGGEEPKRHCTGGTHQRQKKSEDDDPRDPGQVLVEEGIEPNLGPNDRYPRRRRVKSLLSAFMYFTLPTFTLDSAAAEQKVYSPEKHVRDESRYVSDVMRPRLMSTHNQMYDAKHAQWIQKKPLQKSPWHCTQDGEARDFNFEFFAFASCPSESCGQISSSPAGLLLCFVFPVNDSAPQSTRSIRHITLHIIRHSGGVSRPSPTCSEVHTVEPQVLENRSAFDDHDAWGLGIEDELDSRLMPRDGASVIAEEYAPATWMTCSCTRCSSALPKRSPVHTLRACSCTLAIACVFAPRCGLLCPSFSASSFPSSVTRFASIRVHLIGAMPWQLGGPGVEHPRPSSTVRKGEAATPRNRRHRAEEGGWIQKIALLERSSPEWRSTCYFRVLPKLAV